MVLGIDAPFISTIVLSRKQLFPQGFGRFFRKKDAWKEWGRYPDNLLANTLHTRHLGMAQN